MIVAHKIALDPNAAQIAFFNRSAGTARFAYNWALEQWQARYKAHRDNPELPVPRENELRKQLTELKKTPEYAWLNDVSAWSVKYAVKNLDAAFKRFFKREAKYPRFKKRGVHDAFRIDNGPATVTVKDQRIKVPRLGWVRMREALRFTGEIKSAVVSRTAGRWFVAIAVETSDPPKANHKNHVVGVDLGLTAFATISDGSAVTGPKPHKALLGRLKRLSRSLSRKRKGSNNRRKAKEKLAKLHYRIACIRQDAIHKLTTHLTRTYEHIGIEDLNVRGMMANRALARSVADMGFHEFKRQLEYKAKITGSTIHKADRWYPSSKICHVCKEKNDDLTLSTRLWVCRSCGTKHDRDVNAAINLEKLAASCAVTACGEESSGSKTWSSSETGLSEAGNSNYSNFVHAQI